MLDVMVLYFPPNRFAASARYSTKAAVKATMQLVSIVGRSARL
jgi:hypothetical protein